MITWSYKFFNMLKCKVTSLSRTAQNIFSYFSHIFKLVIVAIYAMLIIQKHKTYQKIASFALYRKRFPCFCWNEWLRWYSAFSCGVVENLTRILVMYAWLIVAWMLHQTGKIARGCIPHKGGGGGGGGGWWYPAKKGKKIFFSKFISNMNKTVWGWYHVIWSSKSAPFGLGEIN
jgi:hypothetical protein